MAITTIEQLTLKEDAVGENDLLIIAEKNGNTYTTKSIKANAVGGGGGGGADDYVVSFTLTMDGGSSMSVTADHTAAEVYAAYQQGKNIKGVGELAVVGMTIIFYFTYIMTEDNEMTGVMFHTFNKEGGTMRIDGDANGWTISNLS